MLFLQMAQFSTATFQLHKATAFHCLISILLSISIQINLYRYNCLIYALSTISSIQNISNSLFLKTWSFSIILILFKNVFIGLWLKSVQKSKAYNIMLFSSIIDDETHIFWPFYWLIYIKLIRKNIIFFCYWSSNIYCEETN